VSDVFLSYSRTDRPVAQAIAFELQKLDVNVWWDDHDLLGGDDYRSRIAEVLGRARVAMVLWSRRSIDSQWVVGEASAAREKKILIPLNLDGVEVPLDFRPLHAIDMVGWVPGDQLPSILLKAIAERLGSELSYSAPAAPIGTIGRFARKATQSWYLDFESMLFYLIGQGFACFLCTLPFAFIMHSPEAFGAAATPLPEWMPYAFSLLIGALVAPLHMRPVLETLKLPVAIPLFGLASIIGVASYMIGYVLMARLQIGVLLLVGPSTLLFLLVTALANRINRN
jgi:TIR domain-containing protein